MPLRDLVTFRPGRPGPARPGAAATGARRAVRAAVAIYCAAAWTAACAAPLHAQGWGERLRKAAAQAAAKAAVAAATATRDSGHRVATTAGDRGAAAGPGTSSAEHGDGTGGVLVLTPERPVQQARGTVRTTPYGTWTCESMVRVDTRAFPAGSLLRLRVAVGRGAAVPHYYVYPEGVRPTTAGPRPEGAVAFSGNVHRGSEIALQHRFDAPQVFTFCGEGVWGADLRRTNTYVLTAEAVPPPGWPPAAAAPGLTTGPVTRLEDVVQWTVPTAAGAWPRSTVVLPPALAAAVRGVAPGWRPLRHDEVRNAAEYDAARPARTASAVVADLDGDGQSEAVLVGLLADRIAPPVDRGFGTRTADRVFVVLGVRETPGGYAVTELARAAGALVAQNGPEEPLATATALSVVSGTPAGASTARGPTTWVRWQDEDCKTEGRQWTLRAGRWVRATSDCAFRD
jgi:hypothetical protein